MGPGGQFLPPMPPMNLQAAAAAAAAAAASNPNLVPHKQLSLPMNLPVPMPLMNNIPLTAEEVEKLKNNEERRPWTKEEDRKVLELVKKYGTKKWSLVGSLLDGRTGKQCRERWHNHLNPNINKQQWSAEEDLLIIDAHKRLGSRWSEIAKLLVRLQTKSLLLVLCNSNSM